MIDPAVGQLLDQAGYYREFTKNGIRTDGRGFSDHRHIAVGSDDSRTSSNYGSSSVNAGKTKVSCSITVLIGTPSQQHPESGDVDFDVSLWPHCNIRFDQRSKPDEAFLLEQLLSDLITKGRVLDLTQLGIERGRFAFRLSVKVLVISDDGNLTDATVLAVVRALMDLKLPQTIVGDSVSISSRGETPLELLKVPIAITLGIFDEIFLVDPSTTDENVMRGSITCAIDECGALCFMSQNLSSGNGLSGKHLEAAIDMCRSKASEIRNLLMKQ